MKKNAELALALVLALVLCLLSGCTGRQTALKVNVSKVDMAEYAFYLNYAAADGTQDAETLREAAVELAVQNTVIRQKCEENGLKVTKAQKNALKREKKELISQLGGKNAFASYLESAHLTPRGFDRIAQNSVYYEMLRAWADENIISAPDQTALREIYEKSYACVKYIFLSTLDDGGVPLLGEKKEEVRLRASELAQKAQTADFDGLCALYSDDIYASGGTGGVVVGPAEAAGTPYLEGALALSELETGGPFEQSDGYYIVKRLPSPPELFDENAVALAESERQFSEWLQKCFSEASVERMERITEISLADAAKYIN